LEPRGCEKIRRYLDSYLDNELLVETNHEVLKHLEGCRECAAVLEGRARAKHLLQRAVQQQRVPVDLTEKIQKRLRAGAPRRAFSPWRLRLAAVAAMLVLALGGVLAYRQWVHEQIAQQVAALLGIGVEDHVTCGIDHGLAERRFTPEEMAQKLGPDYIGLVSLVREKLPGEYKVVVGHRCRVQDRGFAHLILKREGSTVSLVITAKRAGEQLPEGAAAVNASGIGLHAARLRDWEVAGFETKDYLAFVVSDLSPQQHVTLAASLAPALRDFLVGVDGAKLSAIGLTEDHSTHS
jgi:anti-sigma factor RsiW